MQKKKCFSIQKGKHPVLSDGCMFISVIYDANLIRFHKLHMYDLRYSDGCLSQRDIQIFSYVHLYLHRWPVKKVFH